MRYLLIGVLFFQIACSSSAKQITPEVEQVKAERKLFQKGLAVIKNPKDYSHRESENGKEYDPKPRVVLIDERAGKYELRWIGYDGKEKIVKYQKQDAIEAVVEASIEKTKDEKFKYKYLIKNLPTSPTFFHGFTVQTFASDIKDEPLPIIDDVFVGHMANYIPDFSRGTWRYFARLGESFPRVLPGKNIEFTLTSSGSPGIVECRGTAGEHVLKGVGEHKPSELENAMPGYDGWATCATIGPVDKLAGMNKSERSKYVLDNLPKFQEAGWMSPGTAAIYRSILEKEDLAGTLKQAKKDLEKEFITSEVFHIIDGLNR